MLRLVRTRIEPITLELAKEYRDMRALTNERPVTAKRARRQLRLIGKKAFFTANWGQCKYRGKWYRGNGQHTSNVIVACIQAHENGELDAKAALFAESYLYGSSAEWPCSQPSDFPAVKSGELNACIEDFEADEPDDLIEFFSRYDPQISVRSGKDLLGIYQGEQDDLIGLGRDKVAAALKGVLAAAVNFPAELGMANDATASEYTGGATGMALRIDAVRTCVKWMVESVTDYAFYKQTVGAQLCAELYVEHGPEHAESLISTFIQHVENDIDPAASFDAQLNKRINKPTTDSLLAKGRKVFKQLEAAGSGDQTVARKLQPA